MRYLEHQLARIYILAGEPRKALDRLEPLLRTPYYLSPGWLRIDPTFDPLRKLPRLAKAGRGHRMTIPVPEFHLAQVNVARARGEMTDPAMADFAAALPAINALAEGTPGFVWRLQTEDGDATAIRPYEDNRILINLSVWTDLAALGGYVFRSDHATYLRRRREWFERFERVYVALWWVRPATGRPWRRRWNGWRIWRPKGRRRTRSASRRRSARTHGYSRERARPTTPALQPEAPTPRRRLLELDVPLYHRD